MIKSNRYSLRLLFSNPTVLFFFSFFSIFFFYWFNFCSFHIHFHSFPTKFILKMGLVISQYFRTGTLTDIQRPFLLSILSSSTDDILWFIRVYFYFCSFSWLDLQSSFWMFANFEKKKQKEKKTKIRWEKYVDPFFSVSYSSLKYSLQSSFQNYPILQHLEVQTGFKCKFQ